VFQDWALTAPVTRLPDRARVWLSWVDRHRLAIVLSGALAAVFFYRIVVLRSHVALGIDGASYLTTMHQLFGTDVTGMGLPRPPLVGIALWPLVQLFGPIQATKLLAVAVSVAIAVPFYLLCSRFAGRPVAAAISLPFIFSVRYMDALNWGFLTLAAVGLFTLCFYLIYEIVRAPSFDWGRVAALGVAALALAGTNRISAFIFVVTALVFGVAALIAGAGLRRATLRLVPPAILALLASLLFVPTYLRASFALSDDAFLDVANPLDGVGRAWDNLRYYFPADPPLLWAAVAVTCIAGAAVLLRRDRLGGALLLALFAGPLAMNGFLGGEIGHRSLYFLYLPVWLGVAVSADALLRSASGRDVALARGSVFGLALLASLAGLTMWRGHSMLSLAADWYGYLGTEHVSAIGAVDRYAPAGAGVAYPVGLGAWAEGATGRRVYRGGNRVGQALLAGDRVTTNGSAFVADAYPVAEAPMDPALGIDNGQLDHLLYLDDGLIELEYGASPDLRRLTLADAALQESITSIEGGTLVDQRTYELDGLRVVKEVRLPAQGGSATVALRAESNSGPITSVVVPVRPALPSLSLPLGPRQAAFAFTGSSHFADGWQAGVSVDLAGGEGEEATLTLVDGEGEPVTPASADGIVVAESTPRLPGEVSALAEVKPHSRQAEMVLVFSFEGEPSGGGEGLQSFAAADLIREHDISFVLVDMRPEKPHFGDPPDVTTLAWLEDAPYLRPLWQGDAVAAYLVEAPPEDEASSGASLTP
jgi:hypothetical protein